MDDVSKLDGGSKIPPTTRQVVQVDKKRKIGDQDRRARKDTRPDKERDEEEGKHLIDIQDTEAGGPEREKEPETTEVDTVYENRAKPKKTNNPKVDVVI